MYPLGMFELRCANRYIAEESQIFTFEPSIYPYRLLRVDQRAPLHRQATKIKTTDRILYLIGAGFEYSKTLFDAIVASCAGIQHLSVVSLRLRYQDRAAQQQDGLQPRSVHVLTHTANVNHTLAN